MPKTHTVKQGEHMAGIVCQYGFEDYKPVWEDGANADLKGRRKNPNVLSPGDQLTIPDREQKEYDRPTDNKHRFKLHRTALKLRVELEELYGKVLGGTEYVLTTGGQCHRDTTTGAGIVEQPLGKQDIRATLAFAETLTVKGQAVKLERKLDLLIGHLDPVDQRSGQEARLANLGYYFYEQSDDDSEFESAVEEFQCDNGIAPVTGQCDGTTIAALLKAHGC